MTIEVKTIICHPFMFILESSKIQYFEFQKKKSSKKRILGKKKSTKITLEKKFEKKNFRKLNFNKIQHFVNIRKLEISKI